MKSSQNIAPIFIYFFLPEIGLKFDKPDNLSLWTDTQRSVYQKNNTQDLINYLKSAQKKYFDGEIDHPEVIEDVKGKFRAILSNYTDNIQNTFKKRDCFSKYCALCDWYKEVDKVFSQLSSSSDYIIFNNSVFDFIRGEILLSKSKLYDFPALKDYIFESKIETIYKKGSTFMPTKEPEKLVACIKSCIKKGMDSNPGIDEFKLSVYKLLEAYGVLYSLMSGIRKLLGSFRYDYNALLWNAVVELENQLLVEKKNSEILGLYKVQKRIPRAKRMEFFINSKYDGKKVIACLKSFIKGNKGKRVAIVISAAYKAGITNTERIPYATIRRTFGDIGAESGYNYYFRDGVLNDEDVFFTKKKLLNRFSA